MKKQLKHFTGLVILIVFLIYVPNITRAQSEKIHTIKAKNPTALREFFRYTPDRIPFISAHRGGARPGFPENCIATFENTLRHIPAIIEVDPRLTKDSVVVLMHDVTVDRTTNGTGRVADYTWAELKKLKLRDTDGNVTEYGIPTLDEALEWAKGKTILILDKKTVPVEMTASIITERKAENYAMVIAYNYAEAKKYHEINKDIMMEVFMANKERVAEFEKSGVPWKNIVAFIAQQRPDDKEIYEIINGKGAMCIVGSHRFYDKEYLSGRNRGIYEEIINEGADIIEADWAIEAGKAIQHLAPRKSSKSKFFGTLKLTQSVIQ
jgi:glycerophosphoryl diester phosphodiesterase